MKNKKTAILATACLLVTSSQTFANGGNEGGGHGPTQTFFWIGLILLLAIIGRLVEKFKQPGVLGELLIGVLLGNLGLVGLSFFEGIKEDQYVSFLGQVGLLILLFQVGLESNLGEMRKVGGSAFKVATVGVIVPFVLGTWVAGPWLFPGSRFETHLFLGAALTATSVGITSRVFKDFGKLNTKEAKIVLGAAVIDDVFGLIILAVVSAIVTLGTVSPMTVALITGKALLFLVGSIYLGTKAAPYLGSIFSRMHDGLGSRVTLCLTLCFIYSAIAGWIGLDPIIGAFAAGLVLDPVHFRTFFKNEREKAKEEHVDKLIEPIGHFIVPVFFVYTGLQVDLRVLFDPQVLLVALVVTLFAFIGKYVSSLGTKGLDKNIIGFGMVPRGEVGLIFATAGRELGVLNDNLFSVIVIMVIMTTLLTPPILAYFLGRKKRI